MKRISLKEAQKKAVALLGPMGTARVHKGAPGARYQIGLVDTDGVLRPVDTVEELQVLLKKPGPTFKKVSEGRDFVEALQNATNALVENAGAIASA
jgi:hypothetical protein